ncbi:Manganese lipoxygenase [Nymphon striatum]|nr:Manganese lipoxygenase [Nymphon striatum]
MKYYSEEANCEVIMGNALFTDCLSVYWDGVTLFMGEDEFKLPMSDVCTRGNKTFYVNVTDPSFVQAGEMALILRDRSSHVKPDNKEWWIERITVRCPLEVQSVEMTIGVGRPIDSGRKYTFMEYDSQVKSPPHLVDQRTQELARGAFKHDRTLAFGIGPLVLKELVREDAFEFKMALLRRKNLRDKMKAARVIKTSNLTAENIEFKSLNEIENFWNGTIPGFPQPEVVNYWKEDTWFAAQRIQGADPGNIALVKRLNKAFKLNESRVKALTGHSADNLIKAKRLFITDIEILTKFPQVFYPDDPKYTWLLAKIFYNCAEAAHHQMVTHLGNLNINIIICKLIITGLLYKQGPKFDVLLTLEILKLTGNTHLLLDQIATIMFRYVSPSHPVFKLMKPHFYEMFGINFAGMYILLSEGGVADLVLTSKRELGLSLLIEG